MMDFTSIQAQAKEVAPSASREGGQTEATATRPLSPSPLTTDGVTRCTASWQRYTHRHCTPSGVHPLESV
jgi:hypothetical protein